MSSFSFSSLLLLSFLLLLSASSVSSLGEQAGGKVGGRTEIKDAATDEKVRSLGRFAVEEHNRSLFLGGRREGTPSSLRLSFDGVVAAQEQVVSGTEYFLRVAARDRAGVARTYDAVVLVKPWLNSQKLLSFALSDHN
ncbi:putative cysteine proteinase inhibitor 4 [Iris pallida]|uniref:Cysteine proteinase inhibitor 4 n=1 Tax=Iris pallida TaxID=29817 RepID=A0AAX6I894_IRIPA|nr:putative cysteine proteinase inhibitor 4 [Iris pallida]